MERLWIAYSTKWTLFTFARFTLNFGIAFLVLPLYLFHSFEVLIIFQSIVLGAPVFGLYAIGRYFLKGKLIPLIISSSYLFLFLLAGPNWYLFHFQTMFIPLFIYGYLFYLQGKTRVSLILLVLSGLVRYPYIIFPFLFSLVTLLSELNYFRLDRAKPMQSLSFSIPLLVISLTILILTYVISGGTSNLVSTTHIATSPIPTYSILVQNINNKIFTALLILSPFLFTPLLSRKWAIFLLPYFFLLFTNGGIYAFPSILFNQYLITIIAFLYLGCIDFLWTIQSKNSAEIPQEIEQTDKKYSKPKRGGNVLTYSTTILVLICLLGYVYLPYSPVSDSTYSYTNISEQYSQPNMAVFLEATHMVKLVPSDCNTAVFQNNLPIAYPRPSYYGHIPIPGTSLPYNLTYHLSNDTWRKLTPSYVMDDPSYGDTSQFTDVAPYPYNISMAHLVEVLYASGYGIVAQASGITLFKASYAGSLQYYVPLKIHYSASSFTPLGPSIRSKGFLSLSNMTNSTASIGEDIVGPYISLSPGTYQLTYVLSSTNTSAENSAILISSANVGKLTLAKLTLKGNDFVNTGKKEYFSLNFTLTNSFSGIEFRTLDALWHGELKFYGVYLNETSPPPILMKS